MLQVFAWAAHPSNYHFFIFFCLLWLPTTSLHLLCLRCLVGCSKLYLECVASQWQWCLWFCQHFPSTMWLESWISTPLPMANGVHKGAHLQVVPLMCVSSHLSGHTQQVRPSPCCCCTSRLTHAFEATTPPQNLEVIVLASWMWRLLQWGIIH